MNELIYCEICEELHENNSNCQRNDLFGDDNE
jgi:hypothetical protein